MNYQEPNYQNHKFYGNDIKITNAFISLGSLSEKLRLNEISVHQGNDNVNPWDEYKMSQFIESILLKIPMPVFYFDVSNPNIWLSINGLQKLVAIKNFMEKGLVLNNMEVLTHLNGRNYTDLENNYKRIIYDTQVITYQVEAQTPINLRELVFKKIRDMNEY
ncbi:MAG: DUF262 domain-containing protein [Sulfurovum sp.]